MKNKLSQNVKNHFSKWEEYDNRIKKIIPFYEIQFQLIIDIIKKLRFKKLDILEIGIGTGNLAERLLKTFPHSHVTGIDFVKKFISIAKTKLHYYHDRVSIKILDIKDYGFNSKFHVAVSSFVFHHSTHKEKAVIYEKIYKSLHTNGMFIICDFIGSQSSLFYKIFDQLRIDYMRDNGIGEDEIKKHYTEHRKMEYPLPCEQQYDLLKKIGFTHIECFWKYLNLAILGGIKDTIL